jgi:hypothetical protein
VPTFDGGYCFLTALLPISTQYVVRTGDTESSPVELVREALSQLGPAHQSPPTMDGPDSPFAHDDKTHFARLAVIDTTIFNGRMPTDAILDQSDRLLARPVDELNCPYLMVVIDFDARRGDPAELREYLEGLWVRSAAELKPVFKHCFGFPKESDGKAFAEYVMARQIDTTMPFNDYRPDDTPAKAPPPRASNSGTFRIIKYAVFAFYAVFFGVLYLICDRLGLIFDGPTTTSNVWAHIWYYVWPLAFAAEIVVLIAFPGLIMAACAFALINAGASKRFPFKTGSDLPSVLKALYLQREFGAFVIAAQNNRHTDAQLQASFAAFVTAHRPGQNGPPTQEAGRIP